MEKIVSDTYPANFLLFQSMLVSVGRKSFVACCEKNVGGFVKGIQV